MKLKPFIMFIACCVSTIICSIGQTAMQTIEATGSYTMLAGMEEPFSVAEERARKEARRSAIEQVAVYVESLSSIREGKLTHDEVRAISSGLLRIQEEESKREFVGPQKDIKFTVKIKAVANASDEDLRQLLQNHMMLDEIVLQYQTLTSMLEAEKKQNEEIKQRFAANKERDDKTTKELQRLRSEGEKRLQVAHYISESFDLHNIGQFNEAIERLKKVIAIDPQNGFAYFGLGDNYGHLGDSDASLTYYLKALEYYTGSHQKDVLYNNLGMAFGIKGDNKQSILYFQKAVELAPYNGLWRANLGGAYVEIGDYKNGIIELSKALEQNVYHNDAKGMIYGRLGVAYRMTGDNSQAISYFLKAAEYIPNDVALHSHTGSSYYDIGDFEKAIKEFTIAIGLNPKQYYALFNRGSAYYKLGDYENAFSDYQNFLLINPHIKCLDCFIIGDCYLSLKQYEEALSAFNRAESLIRTDTSSDLAFRVYGKKGVALSYLERYEEALEAINQCLLIAPNNSWAIKSREAMLKSIQ